MTGRIFSQTVSVLAILAALATNAPAFARVGVTSTSAGEPIGKPVDQAQRVLRVGIDVFASERVTTTANDRAQLIFLDGSALSIGPNAELTLDKYVYDPAKGTGTIAITAGKGVLRLVGGAITKQTEATITTPSGTIGIRGGITIVEIIDQTQTNAYFIFGRGMRGTTNSRSETATRPGSAITLRTGRPPSAPFLAGQQALANALSRFEAPTGSAAAGAPLVEERMAQSQVTARNSADPNAVRPPQVMPTVPASQYPNAATQVPVYGPQPTPPNTPPVTLPITPPITPPVGGTAVYSGYAIGGVVNGSNRYVAAGTFTQTWNFSSRSGTVAINNFDGVNYAGTTAGSRNNVNFAGPITGTAGREGKVSGSFIKSPTDTAAYQAGTFSITGTNYKAIGVFAGQR